MSVANSTIHFRGTVRKAQSRVGLAEDTHMCNKQLQDCSRPSKARVEARLCLGVGWESMGLFLVM